MNQAELIKDIASAAELKATDVEHVLKTLAAVVQHEMGRGGEVALPGIGKLSVAARAARTGRNPSTGEALAIPAKTVPHFSAAKALKDAAAG